MKVAKLTNGVFGYFFPSFDNNCTNVLRIARLIDIGTKCIQDSHYDRPNTQFLNKTVLLNYKIGKK